jgi:CRISPR/Cas system-associated exonuclease Cas4 (RecB family)
MWGGWNADAPEEKRKAYQLNRMDNIYSLLGTAVEEAVMWSLRQLQQGASVDVETAYQQAARPLLNRSWQESRQGQWKKSPKRYCCLREHYYNEWTPDREKEITGRVVDQVRACIQNFLEKTWPTLEQVQLSDEVPIATVGRGDPENFEYNGVKIYAIPDYVHRAGEQFHIHDWKAGKVRDAHKRQLAVYGLWAHAKYGVAPEQIIVYVQYLKTGQVVVDQITPEHLASIEDEIRVSIADMAEFLEDGDIQRNQPIPRDEWLLAAEPRICRNCNFRELCRPELEADGIWQELAGKTP